MKLVITLIIVGSLAALNFSNNYAKLGLYKQCLKEYNIVQVGARLDKAKSIHSINRLEARIEQIRSICKLKSENEVIL